MSGFLNPAELFGDLLLDQTMLFFQVPWLFQLAVSDEGLIRQYFVIECLADGIPRRFLSSCDWLTHFAVPGKALASFGIETLAEARAQLTKLMYHRLHRVIGTVWIQI